MANFVELVLLSAGGFLHPGRAASSS